MGDARGARAAIARRVVSSSRRAVVVEHYILAEIDKAADLGSLQVSVEISDPELWAVPCLDMGEFLRCPWSGAELPASALDDLAEMRHATEERHA